MLFAHPPPALASVLSRTDTRIDDEAAGAARHDFREASERRRIQEKARIAKANRENKTRLMAIKSKTDDGDAKPSAPHAAVSAAMRFRLQAQADFRERAAAKHLEQAGQEHAAHRHRMANIKPTVDDDTEDDATGEARARLRVESAARRAAKADALKAENQRYFAAIGKVTTLTDSKIWDE